MHYHLKLYKIRKSHNKPRHKLISLASTYTILKMRQKVQNSQWSRMGYLTHQRLLWLIPCPPLQLHSIASPYCFSVILFLDIFWCISINTMYCLVKERLQRNICETDWWKGEILTQFQHNLGDVFGWGEHATAFEHETEWSLMMCDKSTYSTNARNTYQAPDINRNKLFF